MNTFKRRQHSVGALLIGLPGSRNRNDTAESSLHEDLSKLMCGVVTVVVLAITAAGQTLCDDNDGLIAWNVEGNGASIEFTFTEGTSIPTLIGAFNTFSSLLNMRASFSADHPQRLALVSLTHGVPAALTVSQSGYDAPLVYAVPHDGEAMFEVHVTGVDGAHGDVNGDSNVDVADLLLVLEQWGPCDAPCPPACIGDITGSNGSTDCDVNVYDLLAVLVHWSQ